MRHGSIDFEMEYGEFDTNDYNWNRITHFSNNYSAEIPDGLKEICKKLLNHVEENDLINKPDVENLNWERIEIDVDCDESTISVVHDYNYYAESDTESRTQSLEEYPEDESLQEVFDELENSRIRLDQLGQQHRLNKSLENDPQSLGLIIGFSKSSIIDVIECNLEYLEAERISK
jgi:hypothetical protein